MNVPAGRPEPVQMVTTQAIHVQVAVAEGRQAGQESRQTAASGVYARSMPGTFEGNSVQRRTDALIDRLTPTTDQNLYVLPAVMSARHQAYEAVLPTHAMQSGLLAYEITPLNSLPISFQLGSDSTGIEASVATTNAFAHEAGTPSAELQEDEDATYWARKQAIHLIASREAAKLVDASRAAEPTRGQFGFSKQLQMNSTALQTRSGKA
jgi:hypothetical protein